MTDFSYSNPQTPSRKIGESHSYESQGDDSSTQSKAHAIFDLIEAENWDEIIDQIKASPQLARSRRRILNSVQYNLPLHEVCRRQPPIHVVDFLLDTYDEAVHTPGQFGFLPLHIACGSGACCEVVTRLLDAYPGATQCRDDTKDALPLHLAAQWGASEEVLMEILTTHPEGSFVRDASGNTPLDLARQLPDSEEKNFATTALETAPILVATAKSAARRVEREMESRLRGIQEAHKEFVRQIEQRHEDEKTEFLQMEVEFHNELAAEKERNCELAEALLNHRKQELKQAEERKAFMKRLEDARLMYKERLEGQQKELRAVLGGKSLPSTGNRSLGEASSLGEGTKKLDSVTADLVDEIAALYKNHERTKEDLTTVSRELHDRDEQVDGLKVLIDEKTKERETLKSRLIEAVEESERRGEKLTNVAAALKGTEQELNSAKSEMNRLNRKTERLTQEIKEARNAIQTKAIQMESVKDLVASLSKNVDSWNETQGSNHSTTSSKRQMRRQKKEANSRTSSPVIETSLEEIEKIANVSKTDPESIASTTWSNHQNYLEVLGYDEEEGNVVITVKTSEKQDVNSGGSNDETALTTKDEDDASGGEISDISFYK